MTTPAITIESWQTAADAAALMLNRDIDRLPVLKGQLVGIITRADLVAAFFRPDREIERDIREEVILRSFCIPDGDIDIAVRDGEVMLAGTVESELIVELLSDAIRRVPGVVGVQAKLRAAPCAGPHPALRVVHPAALRPNLAERPTPSGRGGRPQRAG
jgi:CBS domain-containing protein